MSFLNSKFSNIEISILEIGRRNASLDDPEGRRVILLVIFSLLSLPIMLGVSVSEYFNSHYFLSAALIVGVIVLLINIVVNLSRGFTLWSVRGVTAYFSWLLILLVYLDYKISNVLYLLVLPPVLTFILGRKEGAIWNMCYLFLSAYFVYSTDREIWQDLAAFSGFVATYILISTIVFAYEIGRERSEIRRFLQQERLRIEVSSRAAAELEKQTSIENVQSAFSDVKELSGLVPICASCKSIRDDSGYWEGIETYMERNRLLKYSYGLCPDCEKASEELLVEEPGDR
ncbi:MAG: hypothetical protein VB957_16715 [Pseudomonadales bacterium]